MLSVQTAGCAGMERLGVPTRTSLTTPPDTSGSGHSNKDESCGSSRSGCSLSSHSHDHHQHYQYHLQKQQTLCCPHHVPLPDSEWGYERCAQLRTNYQVSLLYNLSTAL
uniref:Uncharacterized protein n=1 Tax=Glossina austeni TaxID=7395 RepID=A0A1A9V5W4_GLOAU